VKSSTDASSKTARQKDVSDSVQHAIRVWRRCAMDAHMKTESCRPECMFTMLRKPAASATELLSFLRGRRRMLGTRRGTASHPSARAKTSLAGFSSGPGLLRPEGGRKKRQRVRLSCNTRRAHRAVGDPWGFAVEMGLENTKWKRSGREAREVGRYLRAGGGCG
jgi:hypothetical protein